MEGKAIREIGANCLKKVFGEGIDPEKITMRKLFEKTGVELTCTTVDLDDQIIRFLNHKTSPGIPVIYAVQMTGSFPVAFKAQKWQKSWGKYYVHYEHMRKEIDLTGHEFTDGGMLANFPIKYLDNEKMRPMYFAYPKTKKTILYGFGLNQISDPAYTEKKNR